MKDKYILFVSGQICLSEKLITVKYCLKTPPFFFIFLWEKLTKRHLSVDSGQAVSATSHPRRTWPSESGCDCAGSAGSPHFKAHAALNCLTRASVLHQTCTRAGSPLYQAQTFFLITRDQRSQWGEDTVAPWVFWSWLVPDWNRRQDV